jgi:hypothetical protein
MASKYKADCFISYSHHNRNEVMKLKNHLIQAGFTIWNDIEVFRMTEVNYDEQIIVNGIRHSQVFVACISINYINSKKCLEEFNLAARISMKDIVYVFFENIKGELEKMDLLGIRGLHFARKNFLKSDDISRIISTIKDLTTVSFKL